MRATLALNGLSYLFLLNKHLIQNEQSQKPNNKNERNKKRRNNNKIEKENAKKSKQPNIFNELERLGTSRVTRSSRREKEREKTVSLRQCFGPACVNAALNGSKYCSTECGIQLQIKYVHIGKYLFKINNIDNRARTLGVFPGYLLLTLNRTLLTVLPGNKLQ